MARVERIISGGQTGVDQAALDVALTMRIPCGGWCPLGRRSEAGPIPERFPLLETSSTAYPHRTRLNIQDSDGTLIFTAGKPKGGTRLTIELAHRHRRPFLIVDLSAIPIEKFGQMFLTWVAEHDIKVLNIAGPRESESPGIHMQTTNILRQFLSGLDPLPNDFIGSPWPPPRPETPTLTNFSKE